MTQEHQDLARRINEAKRDIEKAKTDLDLAVNKLLGCGLLVSAVIIVVLVLPITIVLWRWALQ